MCVAPPFSAVILDVTHADHAKQQHGIAIHMAALNSRHIAAIPMPLPPLLALPLPFHPF